VRWWWIALPVAVVILVPVAIVALPILTHTDAGVSTQEPSADEWPTTVVAEGEDGRTRELMVVSATPGGTVDTSALAEGDQLVVSGAGYDTSQGIYVAVCVIPSAPTAKPGPCLGGVPSSDGEEVAEGTIQFAPSNWINDDWAWKLLGARSYDDAATGTFTAYLELPAPFGEGIDCVESACAIYTRNDHTALRDRVQDVHIPVAFVPSR
jgi:hypothetical protein